jgi:TonB-linked SusC/RagA family outer membrane protein
MRIYLLLLIIGITQAFGTNTYSQTALINLRMNNASVEDVINGIEEQSEFRFLYNKKIVNVESKVSIEAKNGSITAVLDDLFKNVDISYVISDRQIILNRKGVFLPLLLPTTRQTGKRITGMVVDAAGEPLIGANVLEKGTPTNGTITDAGGNFSLTVADNALLQVSFIGYVTQEVSVSSGTPDKSLLIKLLEDTQSLEEVVVIGYGSMKKSDLTGSITSVKIKDDLRQLANNSIAQTLQGNVAGLNVGAVNSAGAQPSLTIRGYNTLSTGASENAPLIVVDGVIYRGNLIDLNTNDIESVDILKDASSAAIYGSQASNGVIIITTRKGTATGKPVFSYSTRYTVQTPYKELLPMGKEELEKFILDCNWDRGSRIGPDFLQPNPDYSFVPYLKTTDISNGYREGLDHDWYGAFTGNGHTTSHNLSVSGKNQDIGYFISGGYLQEKGYIKNDDYKKYNFRINLESEINDWLSVGTESFLATGNYSGSTPSLSGTFATQPWSPVYDANGEYLLTPNGLQLNPYLEIQQDDDERRLNLIGNTHAEIKAPFLKGLSYRINYSQNYSNYTHDHFNPWGANYTGSGYKNFSKTNIWSLDNIVTYNQTFKDRHKVNLTLVYGVEELKYSATNASAQKFSNDDLGYNRLQAGDPGLFQVSSSAEKESSLYSSARLFYSFRDKYLVTGTVRRDGFSGFGANKKIGTFPSLALAWVTSEESFFKNRINWFNYLKLRGSYGVSGRRAVSRYQTKAVVSSSPSYIFGDGNSPVAGQWISSMANNALGWETTTGMNFGADFGFLSSRIHGNIEYYSNDTKNILYNIQLPNMSGFSSIPYNIGKVHNHGLEFTVTGNFFHTSDFSWETSLNYSKSRNKIVSILGPDNDKDGDGKEDDLIANNLFIGKPQGVIYNYEITGELWQLADRDAGRIPAGFSPGTLKIIDQNDDGAFSATDDRKILGYTDPSFRVGFANTLRYKNFSLYVFINAIQGGKNYYKAQMHPDWNFNNYEFITQGVGPKGGFDYWMPENPNSKYRRLDMSPSYEGIHYDSRSFVRIQDVTLSYTFDRSLVRKLTINNLKLYASGKNLATFTKWEGVDPELGIGLTPGLPLMSSYTIGLNVEF